ncbi:TetR/AcrR family transcriptional regulator [Patulibacter defluvii]|uniref:TetR/AcrR family transcriptional regulator n=1 Tax=Patulibacter defluvii TaxID=3095358 RepID=UPI002A75D16F|nr:TetR/AcrR family transcriptional regulator [Patulibacter sp. DM4]
MALVATTRTYGGQTADERGEERRARLLAAALELFGEEGLSGIGVRSVSGRAGLATRYFYESFANREALLTALYDAVAREISDEIFRAAAAAPDDARSKVRAAIEGCLRIFEEDPRKGRIVFADSAVDPSLAAARETMLQKWAHLSRRHGERFYGAHADDDAARVVSLMLTGGVGVLANWWLDDPTRAPRETLVEQASALYVAAAEMVFGRPPAGSASG